ncbi:MAG: sigma-70 family RNA polymerase sigma factor [Pseudomonadota bacterium]
MNAGLSQTQPQDLAARIAAGSSAAEHELVRRYNVTLLKILMKRCGNREQAEDARQEALLIVLQRLRKGEISDATKLSAFMHRTAINVLIADQRKTSRRGTSADTPVVEQMSDPKLDQLTAMIREESGTAVRAVVRDIKNDRDREILYRFYIRDEEKFSICSALNLTTVHFDRVISRARVRLRSIIESNRPDLKDWVSQWEHP